MNEFRFIASSKSHIELIINFCLHHVLGLKKSVPTDVVVEKENVTPHNELVLSSLPLTVERCNSGKENFVSTSPFSDVRDEQGIVGMLHLFNMNKFIFNSSSKNQINSIINSCLHYVLGLKKSESKGVVVGKENVTSRNELVLPSLSLADVDWCHSGREHVVSSSPFSGVGGERSIGGMLHIFNMNKFSFILSSKSHIKSIFIFVYNFF